MVSNLQKVVEQDPLAQIDEQDKELIWQMRYVCMLCTLCVRYS